MSSQKESLVDKIREHFQSKYKDHPSLSQLLEKELREISKKPTISKTDLDEIDIRLMKVLGPTKIRRNSYVNNPTLKDKSPRIIQPIRSKNIQSNRVPSPNTEFMNETTSQNRPPSRNHRIIHQKELPNAPGFCDNSMYFFSPMDLMVLKKNQLINDGRRSVHQRSRSQFNTELSQTGSPPSREAKSFIGDESSFQHKEKSGIMTPIRNRLPPTQKAMEREKKIKEDIWHKIEDKRIQKIDDLDRLRQKERKEQTFKWAQELKMQIEQKKMKTNSRRTQDIKDSLKHYESEEFVQVEHANRVNKHREHIHNSEKNNRVVNMNSKLHQLQLKNDSKNQESFELKMKLQRDDAEAELEKRTKLEKMAELKAVREAAIVQNIQKAQTNKEQELKQDDETLKVWLEKIDHQDLTRQKYLDFLKKKALKVPAYQVSGLDKSHHLEKKRKGSLDPQKDTNTSLLKFMNAEPHTEAWRKKVRHDLQKINELHSQHTLDKAAREVAVKSYYNEQQDLWKEQEEHFELRERLTKEAQKLKKIAQKQALDEQIKQDKEIKESKLTEAERRWNRSIIRDLNIDNRQRSVQEA